jgi:hypothetical protein
MARQESSFKGFVRSDLNQLQYLTTDKATAAIPSAAKAKYSTGPAGLKSRAAIKSPLDKARKLWVIPQNAQWPG